MYSFEEMTCPADNCVFNTTVKIKYLLLELAFVFVARTEDYHLSDRDVRFSD